MLAERIAFFLRQILPGQQADAVLRKLGENLLVEQTVLTVDKRADAGVEAIHQFSGNITAVAVNFFERLAELLFDAGDAHHVEFIEVAAEDCDEFQTFKQGVAFIGSLAENAGVEFKPADVPVDILFVFDWSCHSRSFLRQRKMILDANA